MFLVIETYNRELCTVNQCKDMDAAIELSNELLKAHLESIGCNEDDCADEYGEDWQRASASYLNAWCNYHGQWDAFIHPVGEGIIFPRQRLSNGYFVRVTEENVDGCGSDVDVWVDFEHPMTDEDADVFARLLGQQKVKCAEEGLDTEAMVDNALEILARDYGLCGELTDCAAPDREFVF